MNSEKDDGVFGLRKAKDRNQFVTRTESPGVQSGDNQGEDVASWPKSGSRLTRHSAGGRNSDGDALAQKG